MTNEASQPYRIEVVVIGDKDEAMSLAAAIASAVDFRHVGPIIVQPCVTLTSDEALR